MKRRHFLRFRPYLYKATLGVFRYIENFDLKRGFISIFMIISVPRAIWRVFHYFLEQDFFKNRVRLRDAQLKGKRQNKLAFDQMVLNCSDRETDLIDLYSKY